MPPTTEYKGLPIRKYSAAVRGASGDALNGALKVAPQDFRTGDRAFLLLEVTPNGDQHKPMDDGEAWEHVEVVKVVRGAFLDQKDALPHLDEVSTKLEDMRIEETGQERLSEKAKLEADHLGGLHKRARKACELCQTADPLGVGGTTKVGDSIDEVVARAEAAAAKLEDEQGQGDPDNPLPAARKYRRKAPGAAKKSRAKRS